MKATLLAMVAIVGLVAIISSVALPVEGVVSCGEVNDALASCIIYLTGHEGRPSRACCHGVRAIVAMARASTLDKRACCGCVKAAASRHADLKDQAAENLPAECGIHLDIPISRNVNCDEIN